MLLSNNLSENRSHTTTGRVTMTTPISQQAYPAQPINSLDVRPRKLPAKQRATSNTQQQPPDEGYHTDTDVDSKRRRHTRRKPSPSLKLRENLELEKEAAVETTSSSRNKRLKNAPHAAAVTLTKASTAVTPHPAAAVAKIHQPVAAAEEENHPANDYSNEKATGPPAPGATNNQNYHDPDISSLSSGSAGKRKKPANRAQKAAARKKKPSSRLTPTTASNNHKEQQQQDGVAGVAAAGAASMATNSTTDNNNNQRQGKKKIEFSMGNALPPLQHQAAAASPAGKSPPTKVASSPAVATAAMPDNTSDMPPIHFKDLTDNDVILGRGNGIANIPGNKQYREFVKQHKYAYLQANRNGKRPVVEKVIAMVTHLDPPGRFLEKDTADPELWRHVNIRKVMEKTAQALREDAAKARAALGLKND